jgi:hypothetical protein
VSSDPVAYIYFSIVKRDDKASSNLPAVLIHILQRKEDPSGAEIEMADEVSQEFSRKLAF